MRSNTIERLSMVFALCVIGMGASMANAATVVFQMGDHPDAALYKQNNDNPYGLRLDSQSDTTFSVSTNLGGLGGQGDPVTLSWDTANLAAGALLSGRVENNQDGTFWNLNYLITGLSPLGGPGFVATGGNGTVSEIGGALRVWNLASELNNQGDAFVFAHDGHRLPGDNTSPVARGWLLPPNSTDDFLMVASPVPLPAGVWLLGSVLLGVFAARRRQS